MISFTNFASLLALVSELVRGKLTVPGQSLLLDAMNIWGTNVIAFALWFGISTAADPRSAMKVPPVLVTFCSRK